MWYFTENEVFECPSYCDGIPHELIDIYRFKGCEIIEKLGNIFRLPKISVASAKVYFHRFFILQSFKKYDTWLIASTCLFLAAKVEEHYMKAIDFSKHYLSQRKKIHYETKSIDIIHPLLKDITIEKQTEELLFTESIVLHVLAYDLGIIHPYSYINEYVQFAMKSMDENNEQIIQLKRNAWSFLNDSSNICISIRYEPRIIAIVAVFLAGCYSSFWSFSFLDVLWLKKLDIPIDHLIDVSKSLLEIYNKSYKYKKKPIPNGILNLLERIDGINHDT